MDHLLTCDCGLEHAVNRSQAGQEIQCTCGKLLAVPTLRGLSELPPVSSPAATKVVRRTDWQGWKGPAIALCSGIMLVSGLGCTWFLLQRMQIDTSYTAEDEIAGGEELFNQFGADELSMIWNGFETQGLGRKMRPEFYLWTAYAKEREKLALISGSIAAVFAALTLGIWTAARKGQAGAD